MYCHSPATKFKSGARISHRHLELETCLAAFSAELEPAPRAGAVHDLPPLLLRVELGRPERGHGATLVRHLCHEDMRLCEELAVDRVSAPSWIVKTA